MSLRRLPLALSLLLVACQPPAGGGDASVPDAGAPFGPGRYALVTVADDNGTFTTLSGEIFDQPTALEVPVAGDHWAITRKSGQVLEAFPVLMTGSFHGEGRFEDGGLSVVRMTVQPTATFRVPLAGSPDRVELVDSAGTLLWSEPIGGATGPLKQKLESFEAWLPIAEHPSTWLLNPGGTSLLPADVHSGPCGAFTIIDTRAGATGPTALSAANHQRLVEGLRALSPAVLDALFLTVVARWPGNCPVDAFVSANKLILNEQLLVGVPINQRFERILAHESAHALEWNLNPNENNGIPVGAQAAAARAAATEGALKGGITNAYRALHTSGINTVFVKPWLDRDAADCLCDLSDTECNNAMGATPTFAFDDGFAKPYGACNPSEDLATMVETAKAIPGHPPLDGAVLCSQLAASTLLSTGLAPRKHRLMYAKLRLLQAAGMLTEADVRGCIGGFRASGDGPGQTLHSANASTAMSLGRYGLMNDAQAFGIAANKLGDVATLLHLPAPNRRWPWGIYEIRFQDPAVDPYDFATPGFLWSDSSSTLADRAANSGLVFVLDVSRRRFEAVIEDMEFLGPNLTITDQFPATTIKSD